MVTAPPKLEPDPSDEEGLEHVLFRGVLRCAQFAGYFLVGTIKVVQIDESLLEMVKIEVGENGSFLRGHKDARISFVLQVKIADRALAKIGNLIKWFLGVFLSIYEQFSF